VKSYTGIGSRQTPEAWLLFLEKLSEKLAKKDYCLRSGGAQGADQAFERGGVLKQIFLPWDGFENKKADGLTIFSMRDSNPTVWTKAQKFAESFHPAWDRLTEGARALHTRNTMQVLGPDLQSPSQFVVCYSPGRGGTEQALRIARFVEIPIFNVYVEDDIPKLLDYLKGLK